MLLWKQLHPLGTWVYGAMLEKQDLLMSELTNIENHCASINWKKSMCGCVSFFDLGINISFIMKITWKLIVSSSVMIWMCNIPRGSCLQHLVPSWCHCSWRSCKVLQSCIEGSRSLGQVVGVISFLAPSYHTTFSVCQEIKNCSQFPFLLFPWCLVKHTGKSKHNLSPWKQWAKGILSS